MDKSEAMLMLLVLLVEQNGYSALDDAIEALQNDKMKGEQL